MKNQFAHVIIDRKVRSKIKQWLQKREREEDSSHLAQKLKKSLGTRNQLRKQKDRRDNVVIDLAQLEEEERQEGQ